jgi:hypothetical protein
MEAKVEETLFQMMAGACEVLAESGCSLAGGHTCEGSEQARASLVAQQRSCVGRLHSGIECVGTYVGFKSVVGIYMCVCTWIGLGIIYVFAWVRRWILSS